jgi:PST family polysaccharide transporter
MTSNDQPGDPLAKRTSRAAGLMAVQSFTMRVVLFGSNWVLGALLTQEDFGVSGLVMIVATFAWTFVGFGLDEVLVQRGRGQTLWGATVFRSGMVIATVAGLSTAALAPAIGWVFGEPRVIGPILILALSFPLGALSIVPSARLTSRMEFGFIIQFGLVELFVTQGLTIAFAWWGLGAYAFALPVPIVMTLRAIAYFIRVPPVRTRLQPAARRNILLRKGAFVAGNKFVNNLVGQGDYIVLGLLATTSAVGYYYFAFRLAAAPVRTIATSLNAVLFPAMTTYRSDPARLSAAAVKSATLLSWLVTPLCYLQMAVADPAMRFLFHDKWGPSVPIIQLLSVGLATESIMAVTRAYLSASGKFDLGLKFSLMNGACFFCACLIGAMLNSAVGVALAISIYYVATQPGLFAFLVDHTGRRLYNIVRIFVFPTVASVFAFGAGVEASQFPLLPQGPLYAIAITTLVGAVLFMVAFSILAPDTMKQLRALAGDFMRRRKHSKPTKPDPEGASI